MWRVQIYACRRWELVSIGILLIVLIQATFLHPSSYGSVLFFSLYMHDFCLRFCTAVWIWWNMYMYMPISSCLCAFMTQFKAWECTVILTVVLCLWLVINIITYEDGNLCLLSRVVHVLVYHYIKCHHEFVTIHMNCGSQGRIIIRYVFQLKERIFYFERMQDDWNRSKLLVGTSCCHGGDCSLTFKRHFDAHGVTNELLRTLWWKWTLRRHCTYRGSWCRYVVLWCYRMV